MVKVLLPLLALFVVLPLAAFGDAVYLALSAARIVPETATPDEAVAALAARKWGLSTRPAKGLITLGEYSFVLMKAFDIRGGVLYRIFPGPRYACRELAFLGMLEGTKGPNRRLAGAEAVRILGRVLEYRGAAR
jgi:hypothetical protein